VQLEVRPVYHKLDRRIRSHVFLCMLAYYLQWHIKQRLAPAMGKLSSAGRILFGLFFFHLEAVFFFFSFFVFALTEFGSPSPAVLRCQ
jgi:hypothetical protein